jgi:hypothetical protein
MSFDLLQVHKLKAQGGAVWQRYCELLAASDGAAHDAPAHRERRSFEQAWIDNPNVLAEQVRELVVARIEAAQVEAAKRKETELAERDVQIRAAAARVAEQQAEIAALRADLRQAWAV